MRVCACVEMAYIASQIMTKRLKQEADLTGHVRPSALFGLMHGGVVPSDLLLRHFSRSDGDSLAARRSMMEVRGAVADGFDYGLATPVELEDRVLDQQEAELRRAILRADSFTDVLISTVALANKCVGCFCAR